MCRAADAIIGMERGTDGGGQPQMPGSAEATGNLFFLTVEEKGDGIRELARDIALGTDSEAPSAGSLSFCGQAV